MNWAGDDPDFSPVVLAYGQSGWNINEWDFTKVVRCWTSGEHENHGFITCSMSDFFENQTFWTREAPEVKNRPALLVAYEPKQ